MNACIPSMNDSSDPVDTSSTRTLEVGSAASRRASSISVTTPVALSLAPGTTRVEPIWAITAAAAGRHDAARDARAAAAREGAEGRQRGTAEDRKHQRRARVAALDQHGEPAPHERRDSGMEDQSGLRGVVVRDEHDGPRGIGRPHLRDHVEGVMLGQGPAGVGAARDVVPDARGRGTRDRAARQAAAAAGQRPGAPPG